MIENDQQLEITKNWIIKFNETVQHLDAELLINPDEKLLQIQRDAAMSIVTELIEEVKIYETK